MFGKVFLTSEFGGGGNGGSSQNPVLVVVRDSNPVYTLKFVTPKTLPYTRQGRIEAVNQWIIFYTERERERDRCRHLKYSLFTTILNLQILAELPAL